MSSSNNKLWLVLGVSAVFGIVGAIYLVKAVGDYNTEKVVTGQVEDWAKLWAPARLCVTGDDSTMAEAGHAFLLHEAMFPQVPGRLDQCDQFIRKIKRPGSESTGVAKVEKSWDEVRAAVKKLANAYIDLIDRTGRKSASERRDAMVAALTGVDAAYAQLRAASSMSAPTVPGSGRPTQLSQGVTVTVDGAPFLAHFMAVRNNRLLAYGQTPDGRARQILMSGLEDIAVKPQSDGADVAADDALWGVWSEAPADNLAELRAGALDEQGDPQRPGALVAKASQPDMTLQARFALGQGSLRVVVFETLQVIGFSEGTVGISMVRSTDGGQTFGAPATIVPHGATLRDDFASRRVDILWTDDTGDVRWLPISADKLQALPPPRRLYSYGSDSPELCTRGDTAWWLDGTSVYVTVGDQASVREVQNPNGGVAALADCDAERALFAVDTESGMALYSCDARRCGAPLDVPRARESYQVSLLADKGEVLAVTQTNQLLVAWRPGHDPAAYLLASPAAPDAPVPGHPLGGLAIRGALSWKGVTHLVTVPATIPGTGAEIQLVPLAE